MIHTKSINNKTLILCLIILLVFSLLVIPKAKAEELRFEVSARRYQSPLNEGYALNSAYSISSFCYGKSSAGRFFISGNATRQNTINGYDAYSVNGNLTIGYDYDGSLQSKEKEQWHITSDSNKSIDGYSLTSKIQDGALLVLKSTNGKSWGFATDPITNYFSAKSLDRSRVYSVSDEELKQGTYYRIILAYKIERKTGEEPVVAFIPWPTQDVYEYNYCIEVYEFFAYLGKNPVTFRDILTGTSVKDQSSVTTGFVIEKNGSSDTVTVTKDNDSRFAANSLAAIYEKGSYTIEIKDPMGKVYTTSISVSEGMQTTEKEPVVYENQKKNEYEQSTPISGNTSLGIKSHTSLMIGHNSDAPIRESKRNGYSAFGISGTKAFLFLRLKNEDYLASNGWEIVADPWGKKESQTIAGVYTGQVNTGALIVQTSQDGINWEDVEKERYANGLYTTDFENYYGGKGPILIYQPSGQDVVRGMYIRVIYAYEIKQSSSKSDYRCMEKYEFYLCCNELDAVTFHNLSAKKEVSEIVASYDQATAVVYQHAETMLSGGYTVNGFTIDTALNPTVSFSVKRNGQAIATPSNRSFTTTGRYDIELNSAVNDKKTVTLFVDRMNTEEAIKYYFGDSFISGKRIFSEGTYPVFEGGKTSFNLEKVDENYLPLGGFIRNLSTGKEILVEASREGKQGILSEPGEYIAVFTTNNNSTDAQSSGDCREFTFHFSLISEGSAPGPIVNMRSLNDYARSTLSDAYPRYYGLTYASAGKGNITLAFATREAALEYAYNYEKGTVEQQSDGSYRYTGSFYVGQKEKIESNWDLTDAIYYFAEQAVQVLTFDFSDEYTVLTLTDDVLENTQNLRTLELDRSVTIFADGQKELFMGKGSLPVISNKPYYYLAPGIGGRVSSGTTDFRFVKDKYGCDSNRVEIIDANGRKYPIQYDLSVGDQLATQGCPSGVVTIHEETVYGDKNEYKAIYIAEGDNTGRITLSFINDGVETNETVSREKTGAQFEVEAFSIASIEDPLDPFGIVTIHCSNESVHDEVFTTDQLPNKAWATPGEYTLSLVNRLGYKFTVTITVTESDYATIMFEGEGTADTDYILTSYGEKNIQLPALTRYGYEFVGYEDSRGNQYRDEVDLISFRGSETLRALWEPKQYTLILKDSNESVFGTLIIEFGKEYELPSPAFDSNIRFIGWMNEGVLLETNTITLDKEQDIILVAKVDTLSTLDIDLEKSPDEVKDINEDAEDEPAIETHKSKTWVIVLLLCCALIALTILGWKVVLPKVKSRKEGLKPEHDTESNVEFSAEQSEKIQREEVDENAENN